ncbi:DNA-directed RNA polymerase II core subunit rpb9 [Blastocladiella emersonii ATCC 22665]|nr:DNA-directed RNA polymerase II core subunit rpb9 [Blastocladiella emersonii ATCC 22665]
MSSSRVRFCPECLNLLYAREDRHEGRLLYGCRRCGHQEEAMDMVVYRHEIAISDAGETSRARDLVTDSTLPKAKLPCPSCGWRECVYFQSRSQHKDAKMTLFYVCCKTDCLHKWSSVEAKRK